MIGLGRRVAGLLVKPRAEWLTIDAEHEDIGSICREYVAILALVPAVCLLAGIAMMGGRFLGVAAIMAAVTAVIVSWVVAIGSSIAIAVIVEKLAPVFKSDGDTVQALKLVAYASTPIWLAGVFYLFPTTTDLRVMGFLWSVYLLYAGLPVIMKTPREQVVPFMLVAVLVYVGVNLAVRMIFASFGVPFYPTV